MGDFFICFLNVRIRKKEELMNEKLIKKWITIVSIVSISISGILGILYATKVLKDSVYLGNVFLTLLTFVVVGLLLLNCVSMPKDKEKMGFASMILIGASMLFTLITIWIGPLRSNKVFLNIVIWICALSIFMNILIGNYLKLEKKLLIIQIISYVLLAYLEFILCGSILEYAFIEKITNGIVTGAMVIAWLTLSIILFIKGKDANLKLKEEKEHSEYIVPEGMMLISIKEYEEMTHELEELRNKSNHNS